MTEDMTHSQNRTVPLTSLAEFPPTVVGHTEYSDGFDLELLDSGTSDEPRLIRIVDGESLQRVNC